MKTQVLRILFSLLVLCVLLTYSACDSSDSERCKSDFDLGLFEANVLEKLDGNVKGYGYMISVNGKLERFGVGGHARTSNDGGVFVTLNMPMHIAGISQFITTVATLHVLKLKGLSVDTKIKDYLPPNWSQGTGIDGISFLDLIAQQAGLNVVGNQNFNDTYYDSLKNYIAAGATGPKVKIYSNTHHALLRVILPRLWDKYTPPNGTYDADFCAAIYQQCIQELLLDQIPMSANCQAPDFSILAYGAYNDNGNGAGTGLDYSLVAGGFGWNMSVAQVMTFWNYSWYKNNFIDDDARKIMMDNTAGLWNTTTGTKGTYFNALGLWAFSSNRQYNSIAMHFPNKVDLVVFTNSPHRESLGLVTLGKTTFDAALGCF